jgi:hypothetical protein
VKLDPARARRFSAAMLIGLLLVGACYDGPTGPEPLVGTWVATTMRITPDGGETVDLLAEGASLTITFGSGYTMTGTLSLPDEESPASMNGTYIRRRNTLEFVQTADTFVRELTWSIGANTLTASDQTVENTEFEIVLTQEIQAVTDRGR